MEEKQTQAEVPELEILQGSGSLLASARKQQKKTIEDIARELNLSVTQIKTIELDQTDGLPEATYVRGYIRGYANLLGLNPDEVLKNYLNPNWQQTSNLNHMPGGISTTDESDGRLFTPVKSLIFLVLVAALAFLWYSGVLSELISPKSADTVADTVAAYTAVEENTLPGNVEADISSVIEDSESEPSGGEAVAVNQLLLKFSETSWVDIRDDQDNRLAYKSYAGGEELAVKSEAKMSVFVGNAAGVLVEYNGSPFDITEFREGVYAKFEVGE